MKLPPIFATGYRDFNRFPASALRSWTYASNATLRVTDAGRVTNGGEEFIINSNAGSDLLIVLRTDSIYTSDMSVTVDGKGAGIWHLDAETKGWIEATFKIPGTLVQRDQAKIRLERIGEDPGGDFASFRYWFFSRV